MKKTKAILITVMVCTMASVCWGQSYWKRTYGPGNGEVAGPITPTSDGNFIVLGCLNGSNYLLKITPYGDTLWSKILGGYGTAITSTPDGNFIVAGSMDVNIFLRKITQNGDSLWTKTYDCRQNYMTSSAFAISPTSDGNFIVAGNTRFLDAKQTYFSTCYLKIKSNGDSLWTKTYGGTGALAITQTPDGNFIAVCGWAIQKITSNGDTLWTKRFGGTARAIAPTLDGNFIAVGSSSGIYLLKITQNGDTLWTKTYLGSSGATAITPTPDGNFLVLGYGEGNDFYLFKIKPNGDTLWTKTFGATGYDSAFTSPSAITITPDGDFIVTGNTQALAYINWYLSFFSIINDRYAYKDSLFTFKIPVSGDSLHHSYSALKVPSGMPVSPGGTISWAPKTDSVYMDHVEFLVSDDFGNKDTLTFNIFVNSSYHPTAIKPLSHPIANNNHAFSIIQTSSSQIRFTLPSGVSYLDIYDINGRCVQRIKPTGAQAVWNGLSTTSSPVSSGRYFAKIKEGKISRLGQFTVVR